MSRFTAGPHEVCPYRTSYFPDGRGLGEGRERHGCRLVFFLSVASEVAAAALGWLVSLAALMSE